MDSFFFLIESILNPYVSVAVTACAAFGMAKKYNPIRFPVIITSYGMQSTESLETLGSFKCEKRGLYLITLTIMTRTVDAYFHIYKNSVYLIDLLYCQY